MFSSLNILPQQLQTRGFCYHIAHTQCNVYTSSFRLQVGHRSVDILECHQAPTFLLSASSYLLAPYLLLPRCPQAAQCARCLVTHLVTDLKPKVRNVLQKRQSTVSNSFQNIFKKSIRFPAAFNGKLEGVDTPNEANSKPNTSKLQAGNSTPPAVLARAFLRSRFFSSLISASFRFSAAALVLNL
jgi:hypothetical protein